MPDDLQGPVRISRYMWAIVPLLVISALINYVDRSNLSIAAPVIEREFGLSSIQIGSLLSAFFWTYALMQVTGLAGWLTDRFPVGWVMLGGYVLWSVATFATGFTSSFATLFLTRLLLGIGESIAYPCYSRIFVELPQHMRGRANSFIDAGTKLGPAAGAFLGGLLLVHAGWRMLFFVLGAGGLLWAPLWILAMPKYERRTNQRRAPQFTSIFKLLGMRSAWGSFIGHFAGNYFFYFLLAWLPIYLVREENMSIGSMSRMASAIFLLIASSTVVAGFASDRLISAGVSATGARLSMAAGGLAVASSLIAIGFVHRDLHLSIAIMALACVGYGAFSSNHWAITQTLAGPSMAGRWGSLQNGIANFAGIIAPWVAGAVAQFYGSLRIAFVIAGCVALMGACAWVFLVRSVEPVQWDALSYASGAKP